MEAKTQAQLAQARAYFYAWKMPEAYNILRRYFDRLPFEPEKEHAEYVGMFCRVLMELGKEFELKFYIGELERIYERSKELHIAYTLGVVYSYSNEPRELAAKAIFEDILKKNPSKVLVLKTKMMLADYYLQRDLNSCEMIVKSMEPSGDASVDRLIEVWKAVVARRAKRLPEATEILKRFLDNVPVEQDSYAVLSAKIIYAMVLVETNQIEEAEAQTHAIKELMKNKNLRSTLAQVAGLEKMLQKKNSLEPIKFALGEEKSAFIYGDKKVFINEKAPGEKLLLLLLKKGFLDKAQIVKALYGRTYQPDDDKLIYYHIHSLRKRLKDFGLPPEAIATENEGYRLVPEVETIEDSHEKSA